MPGILTLLYSPSLELVVLVIALVAHLFLAIVVYEGNPKSSTNGLFALLAVSTTFWVFITYSVRIPGLFDDSLTFHRLGIFFAASMSALFFLLAHTFPLDTIQLRVRWYYLTLGATFLMMFLNVSPWAFVDVVAVGEVSEPVPGIGLIPFTLISTLFSVLAVYILVLKYHRSEGVSKKQLAIVVAGMCTMLLLIIGTILVPLVVYNSLLFLPFAPLYTLAFLGATAYAISKYQLFNIKVLLTQALTLVIWLVLFARLVGEETRDAQIVDALVLVLVIVFGFFLVKSVRKEVKQRELIEIQEKELETVNREQEALLHFLSHEVKGYLAKGEAGFAAVMDGTYGVVSGALQEMSKTALSEMRQGVGMVMNILDASNLKKGTMAYKKERFDFKKAVEEVLVALHDSAEKKHLKLTLTAPDGDYTITGDEEKLRQHVVKNLVSNAIAYTPQGSISVLLGAKGGSVRVVVEDTGIGISADDMPKLFSEGGHGKDSIKVNVHSTGFGLFIAKQIVEAHGGKIRAESEGEGKGSRFVVDIPA